ncbi:Ras protein [Mycena venus]|uniref:Ras protein n=1 Tax=Mycena venus TaxID=2733690 RepID=A0A8H6XGA0_9AGAR|nr:Ras protein [Mycena venus]
MDQWTVAVLGDGGVGKTALAVQFTLNCFVETYDPTIEDAYRKQFVVDNRMCFVEVIDTAGQEEYATLRDQWVREGQGFILVYSIASRSTFDRLEVFRQSVRRAKRGDPILMLVGNKADKTYEREVSKEEGAALARQFGCEFIETSAKTALNVERVFTSLVRALRQTRNLEPGSAPNPGRPREREKKKCIIFFYILRVLRRLAVFFLLSVLMAPESPTSTQKFEDADFLVRSWLDGSTFAVNRAKLEKGSHVFRDMFSCCDTPSAGEEKPQVLDLQEPESTLHALLRLLHDPLDPPVQFQREPGAEKFSTQLPIRYDLSTAIPLPVLRLLLYLADKYALSDLTVLESLRAHLLAHAPTDALTVYGLSLTLGDMPHVVAESSQYILPLAWYSQEEVKDVPTVADYHNVLRLQSYRVKALQDILLGEDLFPHGYGMCPTHSASAAAIWDRTRLILARKIETNTDVAGEMESLVYIFQSCATCCKAFNAAVDMLAYKCRRVPRRLDQLPDDGCPGFDD